MTEPEDILLPLKLAAKAFGYSNLARASGVGRDHLYKILDHGTSNPNIETLLKLTNALGFDLKLRHAADEKGKQ